MLGQMCANSARRVETSLRLCLRVFESFPDIEQGFAHALQRIPELGREEAVRALVLISFACYGKSCLSVLQDLDVDALADEACLLSWEWIWQKCKKPQRYSDFVLRVYCIRRAHQA